MDTLGGAARVAEADASNNIDMNIKILFLFLTLFAGASTSAQHNTGMIFKNGAFVNPTAEAALEQFVGKGDHEPALAILTQTLNSQPVSVLDALANDLVRIMLDDNDFTVRLDARFLLEKAARGYGGGNPYTRMQQTFIDLYEASSDAEMAAENLRSVYASGRPDYVRNVLTSAAKPAKACTKRGLQMSFVTFDGIITEAPEVQEEDLCPYQQNTWCMAGKILVDNRDSAVSDSEVLPHCFGHVYHDGQWWEVMY